jgi:uncharacterized membrane protein YeiH
LWRSTELFLIMKSLSVVLKDLQLAQKLLILLSIIFVTAATISGGWIFFAVNHTAQQEISSKAGMLMTTMDVSETILVQTSSPGCKKN